MPDVQVAITEAEIEAAYKWALDHAMLATRRADSETQSVAVDAATDALLWSLREHDQLRDWLTFARHTVRQFVSRKLQNHRAKSGRRPRGISVDETFGPDDATLADTLVDHRSSAHLADVLPDLPTDLQFVVRLVHVDRFPLADVGLLTGTSYETVRCRLQEAADRLISG
jgi:DNA-directed RNA polymerase specialized sigma24 family protein